MALLIAFAVIGQNVYAQQVSDEDQYDAAVSNTAQSTINITQNIDLEISGYQRLTGAALTLQSATAGTQYTLSAPVYPNIDDESRALTLGELDGYTAGGPALTTLRDLKFEGFRAYNGNGGAMFLGGGVASGGMQNVNFTGNLSGASGGGFFAFGNFEGSLTNARFENNRGAEGGGGFGMQGNFSGNMSNVAFVGNIAGEDDEANGGGGFGVRGDFNGNMTAVTFDGNSAVVLGGGFVVYGNFNGNISDSTFTNNLATTGADAAVGGGGFAVIGDFSGTLAGSTFRNNQAQFAGGGLVAVRMSGMVDNVKFFDNSVTDDASGANSTAVGGALAAGSGVTLIKNSQFIGNQVTNTVTTAETGNGGALYLGNAKVASTTLENNIFLNNRAQSALIGPDESGGRGGAIYFEHGGPDLLDNTRRTDQAALTISATDSGRTLFYGNMNGGMTPELVTPNALHIDLADGGTANTVSLTIGTGTDGRVLMLDSISQAGHASSEWGTRVNQTGTGRWALGGVSNMLGNSRWNILGGNFTLTNVRYDDSVEIGSSAEVNLAHAESSFTLQPEATLQGQGTIRAGSINLNGRVDPSTWVNLGTLASDITSAISQADIDDIRVERDSAFGHLVLASANTVGFGAGFDYRVRIDPNNGTNIVPGTTHSLISVQGDATIHQDARFSIAREGDDTWVPGADYTILEATGTLTNNANLASVDAGGNVTYADNLTNRPFLTPETRQEGDELRFRMVDNTTTPPPGGGGGGGGTPPPGGGGGGGGTPPPGGGGGGTPPPGGGGVTPPPASVINISSFCGGFNQCSVGYALDALNSAGKLNAGLNVSVKNITDNQLAEMYNSLTGEVYGSSRSAILGNLRLRDVVRRRMTSLSEERVSAMWINTWSYDGHTTANPNTVRTEHSGIGLALGGDMRLTDNLDAGLLLGYEDSKVKSGGIRYSRVDIKAHSLGGYLSTELNGIELQGGLVYSSLELDSRRNMDVLNLGTAEADYKGHKVQVFAEVAKAFALNEEMTLSPYVNLTQNWLHTNQARERNSAAALVVKPQSDRVYQTILGVRGTYRLSSSAAPVLLTTNLGWAHAFGDIKAQSSQRFAGTNERFTVKGVQIYREHALVGIGVQARVAANTTLWGGYNGQYGKKLTDHAGAVQLEMRF